jgi:5'-phosphate synthase pdxT subunit
MKKKRIGVLALQGDFEAHEKALAKAGAEPVMVRTPRELQNVDGLVLPGGESSTMLNLLHRLEMFEPLREFGKSKPVFGTCAGVILLAKQVTHPEQKSLNLMDLTVERNGYGRQIDSSVGDIDPAAEFSRRTAPGKLEAVFIRAPVILRAGPGVAVLAEHRGHPVLVEQGRHLGATFHPELSSDVRVHQLFLGKL